MCITNAMAYTSCRLPHAHCGCGMVFTAEQWAELPFVGLQDDGDGGELELRNCPCGSTRAALARAS